MRSVNLILDQCLASFVLENFLDSPRDLLSLLEAVWVKLRFNIFFQPFERAVPVVDLAHAEVGRVDIAAVGKLDQLARDAQGLAQVIQKGLLIPILPILFIAKCFSCNLKSSSPQLANAFQRTLDLLLSSRLPVLPPGLPPSRVREAVDATVAKRLPLTGSPVVMGKFGRYC